MYFRVAPRRSNLVCLTDAIIPVTKYTEKREGNPRSRIAETDDRHTMCASGLRMPGRRHAPGIRTWCLRTDRKLIVAWKARNQTSYRTSLATGIIFRVCAARVSRAKKQKPSRRWNFRRKHTGNLTFCLDRDCLKNFAENNVTRSPSKVYAIYSWCVRAWAKEIISRDPRERD